MRRRKKYKMEFLSGIFEEWRFYTISEKMLIRSKEYEKAMKATYELVNKVKSKVSEDAFKDIEEIVNSVCAENNICSRLDRLSRNKNDLKNEIRWFQEHDIRLMILDLPTSMIQVPKGQEWVIQMVENVLIEVLASIAENERNTIRQRQREGIEAAQMKGKHLGRPKLKVPDDFPMVYRQWRENNITAKEAMRRLEMSPSSFYRVVKKYEWEG